MEKPELHTLLPMFDELRDERVVVRPYRFDDAQHLFDAIAESRNYIRPWLPFANEHQNIEETRDFINQQIARWIMRDDFTLSIWEITTSRFIGGTGLHPRDWKIGYFEIGYWIRKSAEGQGFITSAVKLLSAFALTSLHANRLEIRCDARNERSAAVAVKSGFNLEGRLRNQALAEDNSLRTTLIFSRIPTNSGLPPV